MKTVSELSTEKKPFYYMPPWNILFELNRLANLRPWNVNIAYLLATFLEEMDKRGEVDFRASGIALDSSSTIFLMKSRLLLKMEEPPAPPKTPPDFVPPPLFLPARFELPSTTVQELLNVLDEVLKGEHLLSLRPRVSPILPSIPEIMPPLDLYLTQIDEQMDKLLRTLLEHADKGKLVFFSKITAGISRLEAIKTFIVLLFLAQKGDVTLWQDEDLSDVYVTISVPPTDGKTPVGII